MGQVTVHALKNITYVLGVLDFAKFLFLFENCFFKAYIYVISDLF